MAARQQPRNISIRAVLNGYVVEVGCQTVVFESHHTLIRELEAYLLHPKEVEERYGYGAVEGGQELPPLHPPPGIQGNIPTGYSGASEREPQTFPTKSWR